MMLLKPKGYGCLLGLLILFCAGPVFSQPDTLWTATLGSLGDDIGGCLRQTADGGLVIAGYTNSSGAGGWDLWIVRTDALGDVLWQRTYGGQGDDFGHAMEVLADGNIIVTGFTSSWGAGSDDLWLLKLDPRGRLLWQRVIGGPSSDKGHRVIQTADGGFAVAGETSSFGSGGRDFLLLKTDSRGRIEWRETYGGPDDDYCHAVRQTAEGGFVLAGPTSSYGAGSSDFWLVRTDAEGQRIWDRTYGGSGSDNCHALQLSPAGGYLLAGCSWSYGAGGCDFYCFETDAAGEMLWDAHFGGPYCDCCYDLQIAADGGYVLSGWTHSFGAGNGDYWIVKTDAVGTETWQLTCGGPAEDLCNGLIQTSDGCMVAVGHSASFGSGGYDALLVCLEPDSSMVYGRDLMQLTTESSDIIIGSATPNPFNPTTTIAFNLPAVALVTLEVFDVNGRRVGIAGPFGGFAPTRLYAAGHHTLTFDGSHLTSGIYIYRLTAGESSATGKMVLLK